MSKYFVILCVLVGGNSLLSPISTSFIPADTGESITKSDSGVCDPYEAKWLLIRIRSILFERVQLLSMADGAHAMIPLSEQVGREQEYKAIAIAISKLWMNLTSMERTDKLITNVTETLFSEYIIPQHRNTTSPGKFLETILRLYIIALENKFETDQELAAEYKKQLAIAKQFVERDPEMRGPLLKVRDDCTIIPFSEKEKEVFFQDKNVIRDGFVNKFFLKQAVENSEMHLNSTRHRRYLMARALIQKAQSSDYESRVNEMYAKALVQIRSRIELSTNTMKKDVDVIQDLLFNSIETELASDPKLQKEIEALMKQIDFSPL